MLAALGRHRRLVVAAGIALAAAGLGRREHASAMGRFDELREKHKDVSLAGKQAVVVGGTSGIGMGIAVRLAESGADVTIVGRDAGRGAQIVTQMQAAAPEGASPQLSFVACDCFSLPAVAACAASIAEGSQTGKLDFLALTQGMATTQGRTNTADGLDQKLSLHYYSRVAFADLLLPLLEKAEPGGRVLTVLSAGVHGTYDGWREDTGLSAANYSMKNAADIAGFYNDLWMDTMAREHPKLSFIHSAPGFVNTNWGTELPVVLRGLVRCIQPLGASPSTCAEFMCASLFDPDMASGFHLRSPKFEAAEPRPEHEEARELVWEHTMEVVRRLAVAPAAGGGAPSA